MSKFLDELRDDIGRLGLADGWSSNLKDVRECQETLDSLGENARRLLEIGIVQDRLAELGLSTQGVSRSILVFDNLKQTPNGWLGGVEVYFNENAALCVANREVFEYTSPTWQDDLINKVKGLIECKH